MRVICADEPFMDKLFSETSVLVKVIIEYANSVEKVGVAKFVIHKFFLNFICSCYLQNLTVIFHIKLDSNRRI